MKLERFKHQVVGRVLLRVGDRTWSQVVARTGDRTWDPCWVRVWARVGKMLRDRLREGGRA